MNSKQIAAVAVVMVLVCAAVAYATSDRQVDEGEDGPVWTLSTMEGNLPETKPSPKDDFYTSVNYEWLAKDSYTTEDYEYSVWGNRFLTEDNIVALAEAEGGGHALDLYQEFVSAMTDEGMRESTLGYDLEKYFDRIQGAQTLDELTAYLTGGETVGYPLVEVIVSAISGTEVDSCFGPGKQLSDSEWAQADDIYATALSLYYGEEEAQRLNALADVLADTVRAAADAEVGIMTSEQVSQTFQNLPVLDILESYGFLSESGRYFVGSPGCLEALDSVYTEENLEALRTLVLRQELVEAAPYLGGAMQEHYMEGYDTLDDAYLGQLSGLLNGSDVRVYSPLLNDAFYSVYADAEAEAMAVELFEDVKEVFRQRLADNEWLGEETRAKALEKLDAMEVLVGGPDYSRYYADVTMPSASGGSLLDDYMVLKSVNERINSDLVGKDPQEYLWMGFYSYVSNCVHLFMQNTVYITCQYLLDGGMCQEGQSREAFLAGIGFTVAHEITHGFDAKGSGYDKDGRQVNWWTEEDRRSFEERVAKLEGYISSITLAPGYSVSGEQVINEAIADYGAMVLMLDMGMSEEGFDPVEFFECYEKIWRRSDSQSRAEELLQTDAHPPNVIRGNLTVQLTDAFHEAFGISEGDGMWLAPEDRVTIW